MSKKEKAGFTLAEEIKAIEATVPKLATLIKAYKEIAAGYQKFRKNGGAAIPGIEKHLGIKEEKKVPALKKKETAEIKTPKVPTAAATAKKDKKKAKK
jgi:hypothetical protein